MHEANTDSRVRKSTMANTQALKTLITLETKECDQAAQQLTIAKKKLHEAELSLKMLSDYHIEYQRSFEENSANGVNQQTYHNHMAFIRKLEQAILGQEDTVKMHQQNVAEALKTWQLHEKKKLSYSILVKNEQDKQLLKERKRDQKLMDESASRSIRLKMSKASYQ